MPFILFVLFLILFIVISSDYSLYFFLLLIVVCCVSSNSERRKIPAPQIGPAPQAQEQNLFSRTPHAESLKPQEISEGHDRPIATDTAPLRGDCTPEQEMIYVKKEGERMKTQIQLKANPLTSILLLH